MKQKRFPSMFELRPPRPTTRDKKVARRISERLVCEVNLDDFYWEPSEIEDRVLDVTAEIVLNGEPAKVFHRLAKKYTGADPYGWEGIDDHCRAIADEIEAEEVQKARREYAKRYY